MDRKVPINWSVLRERVGVCGTCGNQKEFKDWLQWGYPLPFINCPYCFAELSMVGAVKDFFREKKG